MSGRLGGQRLHSTVTRAIVVLWAATVLAGCASGSPAYLDITDVTGPRVLARLYLIDYPSVSSTSYAHDVEGTLVQAEGSTTLSFTRGGVALDLSVSGTTMRGRIATSGGVPSTVTTVTLQQIR